MRASLRFLPRPCRPLWCQRSGLWGNLLRRWLGWVVMHRVWLVFYLLLYFATLQCMLVYGRGCGCGSRRRDYVARAQKSIFILIGDLASNKSNRHRLIKFQCCAHADRHAHPLLHFEILMLMRKLVRIDCINVDLARMSPVRRCWLQCHYSLHQLQWYSLKPGPPGIYMPLCCWKVWLSEMSVSMFRSFDEFFNVPGTCWLFILSHDYPWHS